VTFAVVLLETAALIFMWCRNKCHDHMNVMMHLPVYLQEVFQLVIWLDLTMDGAVTYADEPRSSCSKTNLYSSFAITVLVTGLPSWSFFVAKHWVIDFYNHGFPFPIFRIYDLRIRLYWLVILSYCLIGWYYGWYPFCTAIGPNGHQIWPVVFAPHTLVRYLHPVLYAYIIDRGVQPWMMVPSYYMLVFMSLSVLVLFIMWLRIGWEAGSFWCFTASLTCLVGLIEPYLFQRFGRRYLLGVKRWHWASTKIYRKYGKCRVVGLLAEKEGVFEKGTYELLPMNDRDLGREDGIAAGSQESSEGQSHGHSHGGVPCEGHNSGSTLHKMAKQDLSAMGIDPL